MNKHTNRNKRKRDDTEDTRKNKKQCAVKSNIVNDVVPFPVEIWFYLLDFIVNNLHALKYRLVSKFWCDFITEHLTVIKTARIDKAAKLFLKLKKIILTDVKRLNISHLINLEELVFHMIEPKIMFNHLKIKSIVFEAYPDSFICIFHFLSEARRTPTLERLTVKNIQRHCIACISEYGKLTQVKEINIINLKTLSLTLVRTILGLPKIERVSFIGCIKNPSFVFPFHLVTKNIKSLRISRNLLESPKWINELKGVLSIAN